MLFSFADWYSRTASSQTLCNILSTFFVVVGGGGGGGCGGGQGQFEKVTEENSVIYVYFTHNTNFIVPCFKFVVVFLQKETASIYLYIYTCFERLGIYNLLWTTLYLTEMQTPIFYTYILITSLPFNCLIWVIVSFIDISGFADVTKFLTKLSVFFNRCWLWSQKESTVLFWTCSVITVSLSHCNQGGKKEEHFFSFFFFRICGLQTCY